MQEIGDNDDLKHPLRNLPLKKSYIKEEKLINIPQNLEEPIRDIEKHIKNNIYEWDFEYNKKVKPKDFDFKFPLPETIFEEGENNKPVIEFKEQNFDVEQLQVRDLTQDQLYDIGNTGTFEVPSQKFDIPYKWKITEWIILGNQNIQNVLYYHLAHCNGNFKRIFARFYNGTQNKCDVYKGLKAGLYKPIRNLYSLIIGKRMIYKIDLRSKLNEERSVFFIDQFAKKVDERALQEFYVKKNNNIEQSSNLSKSSPANPLQQQQNVIIDEHSLENLTNPQILQKINQEVTEESKEHALKYVEGFTAKQREERIIEKINNHPILSDAVKKDLLNIMRACKIVKTGKDEFETSMYFCPIDSQKMDEATGQRRRKRKFRESGPQFGKCCRKFYPDDQRWRTYKRASNKDTQKKYKQAIEKRENIEKQIRETYPILGKHPGFKKKLLLQYCEKEYDFEIQKKHQKILEQLKNENLTTQYDMYKNFMEFSSKKEQIEEKLELENDSPLYTFSVYREYAYPKDVQKNYNKENQETTYYLITNKRHEISTNKRFWRIRLMCLEYYIYLINMIDYLTRQIWIFIKKMFCFQVFHTHYRLKSYKEDVLEEYREVQPFIYQFKECFKNVMKNREEFENSPDDGFLKKRYGRMYNLLKNYVFQLFLYGIMTLLVLLPVLQTIVILILLTILLLSPVIMVGFIIITRLFQLIIYDYHNYQNVDFLCCLPLVNVVIQSGIGFAQALISLLMVIYDILRIIVHFILSIVRFVLLHIYNFFTFNIIIKCLGRVPVSESSIAFRVAGPGVGKMNFFYSLSSENIQLLVRSKMEEIVLKNYRDYVQKEIRKPRNQSEELVNSVLRQPYKNFIQSSYLHFSNHLKKEDFLIQVLDYQISQRKLCFPRVNSLEKVRFKEDELKNYLNQAEEIVAVFVEKDISKEKLREITENILKKIFNNADIIKPLDMNAWQFQLEQQVSNTGNYAKTVKRNLKAGSMKGGKGKFYSSSAEMVKMDDFEYNGGKYAQSINQDDPSLKYERYTTVLDYLQQSTQNRHYYNSYDTVTFFMNYKHYLEIKLKEEDEKKNQKQQQ